MQNFQRKYGLDWPKEVHPIQIDLICAKKWPLEPYCHGDLLEPGEHLLRAARALFTTEEFNISPWTEWHAHAWAGEDFSVWLGGASTSKSNDAGCFSVLWWITDPTETYIALGSTSVPMLKLRSFEAVTRYFRLLKRHKTFLVPGKEAPSQTAIINSEDDGTDATLKASIRGVALAEGSEAKNLARLSGSHLPFCLMVLDEGSALPTSAANARFNAAAGTKRFQFVSLANPHDRTDEATRLAEPVDGWDSVDENTDKWRSKYGLVLHHNGFRSPAVTEPDGAKKYPYLINQKNIDQMLKSAGGNTDDPLIYKMVYGFPAPSGLSHAVLSPADVTMFEADQPAIWDNRDLDMPVLVAGCDPAWTSGGDSAFFVPAKVGRFRDGVFGMEFLPPVRLPISAASKVPVMYQLIAELRRVLSECLVPSGNVTYDSSGNQGLADVAQAEFGTVPGRCVFNAKASDLPLGPQGQPARDQVKDQATEAWSLCANLVRARQVRGLPEQAVKEFCSRKFAPGKRPLRLESKEEYKKRTGGGSPDVGDAVALACLAARRVIGLTPGALAPTRSAYGGFSRLPRPISSGYGAPTDFSKFGNF